MKRLKNPKMAIFIICSLMVIIWSIGITYLYAFPQDNNNSLPIIKQEEYDIPPLESKGLSDFLVVFSLIGLTLPAELSIVFLAEVVIGSAMNLDRKDMNFMRLLRVIGIGALLSIITAIMFYLVVYPAIHDLHAYTKPDTIVYETELEPNFTFGGAVTLLFFGLLFINSYHFIAFHLLQNLNLKASAFALVIPIIAYPVFWNGLVKQYTIDDFGEKTGSFFTGMLIISTAFILVYFFVLMWRLSLIGTAAEERQKVQ
ncbi:MAG: hypothetical protein U9O98_03595 [Asgard group archaeon]|nr:hypothetical protein [Asgard group archaeon]